MADIAIPRTAPATEQRPSLTVRNIAAWLSVVAAITAPLYTLGLVVLTAQLATTYHLDFAAAWQTASLASNKLLLRMAVDYTWVRWLLWLVSLHMAGLLLVPKQLGFSVSDGWHNLLPLYLPHRRLLSAWEPEYAA